MDNHMDNNPNGNRPDNNKGPGRQDPNKNHQSILAFLVCLLVTLVCFAMFTNMLKDNSSEITYDKFIEMVDDGDVKEVTLQSNTLTITPKHQSSGFSEEVYYANQMESVDKLTERLEGTGIKFEYKKPDAAGEIISMLVSVLLPTILLFVLLTVFMRRMNKGGGMMGVGKSRAKAYIQKDTGITFRDVAGQDEAKESLQSNQAISLTTEEHKAVHQYFRLESEKEMIEEQYHFYMGQAQMISYGAMLGKIKKAILGNDDGDTKKLLELLLDTWIDEVEDQLKENTVYQGMLEKISKYEEQSKMDTTQVSCSVRIARPNPWRSFFCISGTTTF